MGRILSLLKKIFGLRIIKAFNAQGHINNNLNESEDYKRIMTITRKKIFLLQ